MLQPRRLIRQNKEYRPPGATRTESHQYGCQPTRACAHPKAPAFALGTRVLTPRAVWLCPPLFHNAFLHGESRSCAVPIARSADLSEKRAGA